MLFIAEMQTGGCFEATTKRKGVEQMIQHFAENDCSAGQIKSIFYLFEDGRCNEICGDVVGKIQDMVDEGVAEWRKIADEEWRGQKEIERDFYAGLL